MKFAKATKFHRKSGEPGFLLRSTIRRLCLVATDGNVARPSHDDGTGRDGSKGILARN